MTRKPPNYWMNQDNILVEIERVMKKHRFRSLPSSRQLAKTNNRSLSNAIRRNGGFRRFRKLLNQESLRVPSNYWKDWNNFQKELEDFINELGHFPTRSEFFEHKKSSILTPIYKYHGGMKKVRERLGYELTIKDSGYWTSLENVRKELEDVMREQNLETIPSQHQLIQLGKQMISYAISKYHGGFRKFRELYGEQQKRRKQDDIKNLDYCIAEAQRIIQKHNLDSLPDNKTLCELGYGYLSTAISRYHGGYNNFRKALGEKSSRNKMGSWQSLEFTIEQSQEFLREHPEYQTIPGNKILCSLGYSSLGAAISNNHGGFPAFREIIKQHITGKSTKDELEELLESYAGDD